MLVIRAVIFRVFSTLSVISCYDTLAKPLFFLPEIVGTKLTTFYFGIHTEYLQKN